MRIQKELNSDMDVHHQIILNVLADIRREHKNNESAIDKIVTKGNLNMKDKNIIRHNLFVVREGLRTQSFFFKTVDVTKMSQEDVKEEFLRLSELLKTFQTVVEETDEYLSKN